MNDNEFPELDESDFMEVEPNIPPIVGLGIIIVTMISFIVLLSGL